MSRVILASSRGHASVARAKSELRRNAGVRRGPRRKIVPIASAERRIANDDESESLEDDLDDDAPLDRGALLRKVFAACDDDKSGYLSIAEFKQLAETNGDAQFAEFVFGTMDSAAADGRRACSSRHRPRS